MPNVHSNEKLPLVYHMISFGTCSLTKAHGPKVIQILGAELLLYSKCLGLRLVHVAKY
jgi:hypothetical protein